MECWVVLTVHVLLQLVQNVAGATLEDVRISPSLLVRAHTPTLPSGHPTVTPTHTALRWVPPAPPDALGRPKGGGEEPVPWGTPGEGQVHSGTQTINTHQILRHSRETRETHVSRRPPVSPAAPSPVFQATPASPSTPVSPVTPASPSTTSPTSWLPRTPVTQARDATASTSQPRVTPTQTTMSQETSMALLTSVTPVTPSAGSSRGVTAVVTSATDTSGAGPFTPASSAHPTAVKGSSSLSQTSLLAESPRRKWATERRAVSNADSAVVKDFRNATRTIARPLTPVDVSQTVNAQLARIWSAGEGDEWRGGSHGRAGGQGPPWSWVKNRRRRRKLQADAAAAATTTPSSSKATPKSAVLQNLKSISTEVVPTMPPYSNYSTEASTESSALDKSNLQIFHDVTSARRQGEAREEKKNPMNIAQNISGKYELPRERFSDGMKVANIYDSVRPGKGTIDFKITKTGDFGGFSVTKTEEVEPISGFSVTKHEEPEPVVGFQSVVGSHPRQVIVDNKFVSGEEDLTSEQGQHLATLGRPPEALEGDRGRVDDGQGGEGQGAGQVVTTPSPQTTSQSDTFTEDALSLRNDDGVINALNNASTPTSSPGETPTLAADATVDVKEHNVTHHPINVEIVSNTSDTKNLSRINSSKSPLLGHDDDLGVPESASSQELAQMKLMKPTEVFPGPYEDTGSVSVGGRGHERSDMTTLSSMFSEDLIPPLPYQWGKEWRSRGLQHTPHSPRKETHDVPSLDKVSDPAKFPFHLPQQTARNQGENGHIGGHGGGPDTHDSSGNRRHIDSDAWKQQDLTRSTGMERNPREPPATVGAVENSQAARHELKNDCTKHDGKGDKSQAVKVRHAPGKSDRGSSWPGPGERVEFVTVVPGGHWDVWGGPPLWDSLAPHTNHTVRNPQVFSVYWGDTGGPGSPAGWPEGVWVIRGGSLAAIMALVVTISVQVARDGPAHRATPTADALYRAHHAQHATLATNLATSLASAHILLIFGIQATGKAWVCGVVGLLLHFLHLVSCCWLLALTVRLLGSLLHRRPFHTALYCTASWGASLSLVVVSYVVNPDGYETRRYCWMSVERGMLVSFIVPVCTLILVNAGVCVAAQKVLLDMRDGVKHEVMSRHKRDLRGAVSLLPLEGVAWFLGVVALEDHQSLALDCAAALVTATLGWLVLYFHGWSWRCHGLCWLRRRLASRRVDDLSLPLTARYDHDLAHQPLLQPHHHAHTTPAHHTTVTVAPPPPAPTQGALPEEFPLQPIFPHHERREVY